MDGLIDKYLDILKISKNKPVTLTQFFCESFELPFTPNYIKMFSKLIKLYGVNEVFLAVVDTYDVDNLDFRNPYGLLVFFLKRRAEKKISITNANEDLTNYSKSIRERIEKQTKEGGKIDSKAI